MMKECLDNEEFLRRYRGRVFTDEGRLEGEEKATITSQWYLQMESEALVLLH